MKWDEYISELLAADFDCDDLYYSFGTGNIYYSLPPIIKATILLLEQIQKKGRLLNIIVFPERKQLFFMFLIIDLLHKILSGEIESEYNLMSFVPGEKLRMGDAIVEYIGREELNGKEYIKIKLADVDMNMQPVKNLPYFQKVSTKKKISTLKQFNQEKDKILGGEDQDPWETKLSYVKSLKTHTIGTVYCVTTLNNIREQLSNCWIEDEKVSDLFFLGQANYEGTVSNIGSGLLKGDPEMVFASDLYSVCAAAEGKARLHSIIIDGGNASAINNQLDALDELLKIKCPVLYVTDTANSFDLEQLSARKFNIWRWNSQTLTHDLCYETVQPYDIRIRNCINWSTDVLKVRSKELSGSMKRLMRHGKETEQQAPQVMKMFARLQDLAFYALRTMITVSDNERALANITLDECNRILQEEQWNLAPATVTDYEYIIESLKDVYTEENSSKKINVFAEYLKQNSGNINLIIPENRAVDQTQVFWKNFTDLFSIKAKINVIHPSECYSEKSMNAGVTVVCGWFNRTTMRKILFSYNSPCYLLLLYDCEEEWKNSAFRKWNEILKDNDNKDIIDRYLSFADADIPEIPAESIIENVSGVEGPDSSDELEEIENIVRDNRYRQYTGNKAEKSEIVKAVPVGFVGGWFAFYQTGHKLISVTDIIEENADQFETKFPGELQSGDFIVVREADRDLIKDMADVLLAKNGKQESRNTASKWRDAIRIELTFGTEEDFIDKVRKAGCSKSYATIERWIEDEDIIAPQSKDDLNIIAKVTENETLQELQDKIYEAAREVRGAHMQAGMDLTRQLKQVVVKELKNLDDFDPCDIWEPIEMEIEGIGNVRILKITDVGDQIDIDRTNTNRLLRE